MFSLVPWTLLHTLSVIIMYNTLFIVIIDYQGLGTWTRWDHTWAMVIFAPYKNYLSFVHSFLCYFLPEHSISPFQVSCNLTERGLNLSTWKRIKILRSIELLKTTTSQKKRKEWAMTFKNEMQKRTYVPKVGEIWNSSKTRDRVYFPAIVYLV